MSNITSQARSEDKIKIEPEASVLNSEECADLGTRRGEPSTLPCHNGLPSDGNGGLWRGALSWTNLYRLYKDEGLKFQIIPIPITPGASSSVSSAVRAIIFRSTQMLLKRPISTSPSMATIQGPKSGQRRSDHLLLSSQIAPQS